MFGLALAPVSSPGVKASTLPKTPSKKKSIRGSKKFSSAFLETRRQETLQYLAAALMLTNEHNPLGLRALLDRCSKTGA